jgi:hypothetical protein
VAVAEVKTVVAVVVLVDTAHLLLEKIQVAEVLLKHHFQLL